MLTSDDYAEAHGLRSLARIVSWANVGRRARPHRHGPDASPSRRRSSAPGSPLDDIDLIEINEAFCSVPVAAIRTLGIDPTIVNVNGSGCSLGHPIAATGARMVVTMVQRAAPPRARPTASLAMCAGGGMGSALVVEVAW